MSRWLIWIICIPLALLGWAATAYFTASYPPSQTAYMIVLPLFGLTAAFTVSPLVWLVARRLHLPGTGERPALALRVGMWIGLWAAVCAGLKLTDLFDWMIAFTLAVLLGLLESFLLQSGKQRAAPPAKSLRDGSQSR